MTESVERDEFRRCPDCGGAIEMTEAQCPFCDVWCCPAEEDGEICDRIFDKERAFTSHHGTAHGGPHISASVRDELYEMYVEERRSIGYIHEHLSRDASYATVRYLLIELGYHTPQDERDDGSEIPPWATHEELSHTQQQICEFLKREVEAKGVCYVSSAHLREEIDMGATHLGKELKSFAAKVQSGDIDPPFSIERHNRGSPICWRVARDESGQSPSPSTTEA